MDSDIAKYLAFPVFWIGSKGVRVSRNDLHFHTCDLNLFNAGFRKQGVVIDSNLICREVIRTTRNGYAPPLQGFRFPCFRHILVTYTWGDKPPYPISLSDLKNMLIEAQRKSGLYVGMAGSSTAYENELLNAVTFEDLVRFFEPNPHKTLLKKILGDNLDG